MLNSLKSKLKFKLKENKFTANADLVKSGQGIAKIRSI